jgi:ElaB/YqjD/DUF883 family membrane-anchored ribosome-binding protein
MDQMTKKTVDGFKLDAKQMYALPEVSGDDVILEYIKRCRDNLDKIYSNKSSVFYKMKGDITQSDDFTRITTFIQDLNKYHALSPGYIKGIEELFQRLNEPIFKKQVAVYMHDKENQDAVFYTSVFTTGYMVLVSELSWVLTNLHLDKGGVLKWKDSIKFKAKHKENFIKYVTLNYDRILKEYEKWKQSNGKKAAIQEAVSIFSIDGTMDFLKAMRDVTLHGVGRLIGGLTTAANPVTFFGVLLSLHYEGKVDKFKQLHTLYEETKKALSEYESLPKEQQNTKVKEKYEKLLQKYEIKMDNARAKIEHYDQRAIDEAADNLKMTESKPTSKPEESSDDYPTQPDDDFDF